VTFSIHRKFFKR